MGVHDRPGERGRVEEVAPGSRSSRPRFRGDSRRLNQGWTMRVIMLGPPGSGKSTHARGLADHFSVIHLSVGALLRREIEGRSVLGDRAAATVKAGQLVANEDVLAVLEGPLGSANASGGWVLDGAPRTLEQAAVLDERLEAMRSPVELVVALEIPDEEVRRRLKKRARADDTREVIAHRIAVWHQEGPPVLAWYAQTHRVAVVDGVGEKFEVGSRVVDAVDGLIRG